MKLSIIIPVFNEEKTIKQVLQKISDLTLPKTKKEVVIIDDGSQDKTNQIIINFIKNKKGFVFITQKNIGKGGAIRTGISQATGDYAIIQDADLEYDPRQITFLLEAVSVSGTHAVYGTRLKRLPNFSKEERRLQFFLHYVGNRLLSLLTSVLYTQWITDMETCYKLFPLSVAKKMKLRARGFELEPELTAKLRKAGLRIVEVPIVAVPRGYEEGKKLNTISDGLKAVYTLLYYRFHE